jgi:hypothetical protein
MSAEYVTLIGIGVQTALYLLAGFALVIRADASAKNLKEEVHEMKEELKKLADVITLQAVQTTRLDNLTSTMMSIEKRVEDMRRGNGYVQRRSATGKDAIDDEY